MAHLLRGFTGIHLFRQSASSQGITKMVSSQDIARMVSSQGMARMVSSQGIARMVSSQGIARMVSSQGITRMVVFLVLLCLPVGGAAECGARRSGPQCGSRPNMVIIIADDLGIGDLSSYGNMSFTTQHVDGLAAEGMRLTHHVAAASLCAPSRTALLTGRYPVRSGMQEAQRGAPVPAATFGRVGLPLNERTFAKLLQQAGYRTQLVGKWHQGWSCDRWEDQCHGPLNHGFDSFFGLPWTLSWRSLFGPESYNGKTSNLFLRRVLPAVLSSVRDQCSFDNAKELWDLWVDMKLSGNQPVLANLLFNEDAEKFHQHLLVDGREVVSWPFQYPGLTQRLTERSTQFIHAASREDKPFLLVHSLLHPHTPMYTAPPFHNVSNHSRYADNVLEMDWAVGQLMEALKAAGVADNTLVHFVSDHGPHLEMTGADGQKEGGSPGVFRGGKGQGGMEGGIRVPAIFRWPGHIAPGSQFDAPTSTLDLFPTLLDVAGVTLPKDIDIDGVSMLDQLEGRSQSTTHRVMFHYCGASVHSVRYVASDVDDMSVYKLYLRMPNYPNPKTYHCAPRALLCGCTDAFELNPPQLFDITADPAETRPISPADRRYYRHVPRIQQALKHHRSQVPIVTSQMEDVQAVMSRFENVPFYQLDRFQGVEVDLYGLESWMEFQQEHRSPRHNT